MRNRHDDGTIVYQVELTEDDIEEIAEDLAAGVFNGYTVNPADQKYKAMLNHAKMTLLLWLEENS